MLGKFIKEKILPLFKPDYKKAYNDKQQTEKSFGNNTSNARTAKPIGESLKNFTDWIGGRFTSLNNSFLRYSKAALGQLSKIRPFLTTVFNPFNKAPISEKIRDRKFNVWYVKKKINKEKENDIENGGGNDGGNNAEKGKKKKIKKDKKTHKEFSSIVNLPRFLNFFFDLPDLFSTPNFSFDFLYSSLNFLLNKLDLLCSIVNFVINLF